MRWTASARLIVAVSPRVGGLDSTKALQPQLRGPPAVVDVLAQVPGPVEVHRGAALLSNGVPREPSAGDQIKGVQRPRARDRHASVPRA